MAARKHGVTTEDRKRYARARAVGRRETADQAALTEARYVQAEDAIELDFAGGGVMTIPRGAIEEVADVPHPILTSVVVLPGGDAIAWPALDVQIYVPGLVERVFGTRMFAASSGRRGGQRTSKAKAAASRENGAKGGRPRKQARA